MDINKISRQPAMTARIKRLNELGQGHIFDYFALLTEAEQAHLLQQVAGLDLDLLHLQITMAKSGSVDKPKPKLLLPAPVKTITEWQKEQSEVIADGENALRQGLVAVVTVAGGQGTRLGFVAPKGTFSITPLREKSLFQVFAEKIRFLNQKYQTSIPWFIMTSPINDAETQDFFAENQYFGLASGQVHFFIQSTIPALDNQARLILDRPDHIFGNPNGHGGTVKALWDNGCLKYMKAAGIRYVFYFQVDNALVRLCDPLFLGYHIRLQAEMSSKVVRKRNASEKVGIICQIDHKTGVVEYSDLDPALAEQTDDQNNLTFWAGSIAIHWINVDFLIAENEQGFKLPWHLAHKVIPVLQADGRTVLPAEPNGVKFESFIFDALPDARKNFTMEVAREEEFSPLKNKDGSDSIDSVIEDQYRLARRWLVQAGLLTAQEAEAIKAEISPLTIAGAEDLKGLDPPRISKVGENWYIE